MDAAQWSAMGLGPSGSRRPSLEGSAWIWFPEGEPADSAPAATRRSSHPRSPGRRHGGGPGHHRRRVRRFRERHRGGPYRPGDGQRGLAPAGRARRPRSGALREERPRSTRRRTRPRDPPVWSPLSSCTRNGIAIITTEPWNEPTAAECRGSRRRLDDSGWPAGRSRLGLGSRALGAGRPGVVRGRPAAPRVQAPGQEGGPRPPVRHGRWACTKPTSTAAAWAATSLLRLDGLPPTRPVPDVRSYAPAARGQRRGRVRGPGLVRGQRRYVRTHQYGEHPALLAQMEVEYTDGTSERVVSGTDWRAASGPIVSADLLGGGDATRARRPPAGPHPASTTVPGSTSAPRATPLPA